MAVIETKGDVAFVIDPSDAKTKIEIKTGSQN